jgi:hypothetical protein
MLASETGLRTGCESLKLEVVTYCRYRRERGNTGHWGIPATVELASVCMNLWQSTQK